MDLEQIINILRSNERYIQERYKAKVKGIFGSYSRHENKSTSDVDMLVTFEKGATLFTMAGLTNYLQDILGIRVDILSERAIKKQIQDTIENDLVRL